MRWNACICDKKNYHSYCWLCMRCEYNRLLRSFFQHLSESFYHFIIAWKWERNKIRTAHKGRVGKKMVHRQRHQVNYFRFAYKKSELRISLISFVIIHTSVDNFLGQFFFLHFPSSNYLWSLAFGCCVCSLDEHNYSTDWCHENRFRFQLKHITNCLPPPHHCSYYTV